MNAAASEFDLFLSYNRLDLAVVESIAVALRERGLRVFNDDWYLRPGRPWPMALEAKLEASRAIVVAIGRGGIGSWQQREVSAALDLQDRARQEGREPPPVIPLLLDETSTKNAGLAFLLQTTWIENWDPRAIDLLARAIEGKAPTGLDGGECQDPRSQICPYRGLGVFREEDAPFYVGRESDLVRLVDAVDRQPMVGVVGASGSGKSSLVRAGLIPHLRRRPQRDVWQIADMMPGVDPFLSLARALLPLREPERYLAWSKGERDDECARLRGHLAAAGADHFCYVVGQILEEEPGTTRLVILVDQWEELYTHAPSAGDAAAAHATAIEAFVGMLLGAVGRDVVRVVLTLRADYWGEVLNHTRLAGRLPDEAVVHLRALDRAALDRIVREPARKTQLQVSDALVETLLDDAAKRPGDLPFLEFALQQLWLQRSAHSLSLDAYRAMGGLERAIVAQAEEVYAGLAPVEKDAVPDLFTDMVRVGEARAHLRRRVWLGELAPAARVAAKRFTDGRLLVAGRDGASGTEFVEVAHEALLRAWPRLGEWIDARRDALRTVRLLQAETRRRVDKHRDPAFLWSHERVGEVADALAKLGDEVVLDETEHAFLGPIEPAQMLANLDDPETTHAERAFIGDRLAALGDPRVGVDVDDAGTPVIAWCDVPGADVEINVPRRLFGGTRPLWRRVDAFHIAAYPVTVAQYRAFLTADDGWRDGRWWDALYRLPPSDSFDIGRVANHPATCVNWFDAVAFCRWLGHRTGRTIRLPDEWEWQQAAAGGRDARVCAWSANVKDPPARVTAVGTYPADRSAAGAYDLLGAVWQWCANKHDDPNNVATRARDLDPRVLRGGSWGFAQVVAPCADRLGLLPFVRFDVVGFRAVCSCHLSSSDR